MKASFHRAILPLLLPPIFGFWAAGCSRIIKLEGERAERARAESAEAAFAAPIDKRPLPDLATTATLQTVLEYAFNSNGEIESAYREWRAAIERIPQAGALDDPKLQFTRLFSPLNIKSFGAIVSPEMLGSLRVMATQDLPAKGKRHAKAEIALAEAEAQGERFRAAKYRLQNRVTSAYARLALNEALLAESRSSIQSLRDSLDIMIKHYHSLEMETAADIHKAELEI
ncbi:TolC family protein, partial [Candidatus Sumerlaeota bacterium]|nr:TolC family protein [Candidatus Sumerlaeota bacterium]